MPSRQKARRLEESAWAKLRAGDPNGACGDLAQAARESESMVERDRLRKKCDLIRSGAVWWDQKAGKLAMKP